MRGLASGFDTSRFIALPGDGLADYPEGVALDILAEDEAPPTTSWLFKDEVAGDGWPILLRVE